jgi:hypothetical protein
MKRFLTAITMMLSLSVWAGNNVLIVGNYGNAATAMKTELEAEGHTVTMVNSLPADLSNVNQIWDLRIDQAISAADQTAYDTFLQNSGYLYLAGENTSFATRNNSISTFTSTLGGGTIVVGGFPANAQDGNDLYFSNNTTVDFIAAAGIDNTGGTGRVLAADGTGIPTAMIWIGNAGDLAGNYNGTVVVIADINWTQSNFYDANNQQFLQELIRGIVVGTTSGTITATGTGTSIGGAPPAPTVVSTAPGVDTVVITSVVGVTTTTVTTANAVSEDAANQTVTTTVTTTNSTPTTTTTCTTPTTVATYSDNSTTITNGTQTCVDTITVATVSSDAVSAVSGRIDQLSQFDNYNYILNSSLGRDLFRRDWIETENGRMYINVNNNRSTFNNGYTADGRVYGVGVEKDIDAVTIIGLRANKATSDLKGTDSVNNQKKDHVAIYGTKRTDIINLHADLNIAKNNYSSTRHIGPYSNSVSTSGTDTWITLTGSKEVVPGVTPFAGVTAGKQKIDGYTETGSSLTARTVGDRSANLNYATVGVNISKDVEKVNLSVTASANTDDLQTIKISVDTFADEKVKLSISATETRYKNIRNTSVGIGLNVRF